MIRVPIHEGYAVAHAIFRPRATGWNGVNNDMNEHGFRGHGAGDGFFIGYKGIRMVLQGHWGFVGSRQVLQDQWAWVDSTVFARQAGRGLQSVR